MSIERLVEEEFREPHQIDIRSLGDFIKRAW